MKISQMGTREAARALCRIAKPVETIGNDKEMSAYLKSLGEKKGETVFALICGAVGKVVPVLLDRHYDETAEILSALTGKDKEEIGQQPLIVTMRDARESIDQDLVDFFTSASGMDGEK
jgi:hypothetical protein